MKIQYVEVLMSMGKFTPIAYSEDLKFNWKILPDKAKIGEYNTQKQLQNLVEENGQHGSVPTCHFRMVHINFMDYQGLL